MHIDVTLGGALVEYLPEGHQGNRLKLSLVTGVTLADVLNDLGISMDQRMLVILNGTVVHAENFTQAKLNDEDKLSLMPPIQAG
ncbi:MAG: MoaD/ThiS family protein [Granulosicoccus sp.]